MHPGPTKSVCARKHLLKDIVIIFNVNKNVGQMGECLPQVSSQWQCLNTCLVGSQCFQVFN